MRILQLIEPGPIAGAERVVLFGSAALQKRGCSVSLVLLYGSDRRYVDAMAATANALKVPTYTFSTREPRQLARFLRRRTKSGERLHVHGYKAVLLAVLFGLRRYSVATHHGETQVSRRVRLYEWIMLQLMRALPMTFAVSDALLQRLNEARVRAVRMLNPLTRDPALHRARTPDGVLRLLFVGRLSKEKGADLLLSALPATGVLLRLVGDGPERERLQQRVENEALPVELVGHQSEIEAHLQWADCFVLPSRREGLPLALLEACAAGLPFIATKVGAVTEVAAQYSAGVVCQPTAAGLSAAIAAFHPASTTQGAAAIRQRYGLDRWAQTLHQAYQEVLV